MPPSSSIDSKSAPSPWSIELGLVIGLPLTAVIVASSLAFVAYVHGFTEMPQQEVHAPHHG